MTTVAILGAGSWGTALAIHLANYHQQVYLWTASPQQVRQLSDERCNTLYLPGIHLPDQITIESDLEAVLHQANDIICAVPSHAFKAVIKKCHDHIGENNTHYRFASACKGIDPSSCLLLSDIAKKILGNLPLAVLSGPSFAKELARAMPTAIVIAANNDTFTNDLVSYFNHGKLRVYRNRDMIGVQVGGALKNIYAIAAGISDGLGFGSNARSAIITRGLAEMTRLGTAMGAEQKTFMGLSGLGDLVLTCTDNQSRNRRFGLALGQGNSVIDAEKRIAQVIEGKTTAEHVTELAKKHHIEMPIAEQVHQCIKGQTSAQQALQSLLARKTKNEF
ncbi:MAG: NAD(P)H-dependent glycerol-3-phosphate dehydrogenase [Pseudomonadota bacterium]